MIRTQNAPFRFSNAVIPPAAGPPNGVNVSDGGNNVAFIGATGFETGWTIGGTIIDPMEFQPLPSENWRILAYSVKGILTLTQYPNKIAGGLYPMYGKFGKIITSLVVGTDFSSPTGAPAFPWVVPIAPIPTDFTNSVDLWDPAVNNLPQQGPQNAGGIPIQASLQLQQPRQIQQAAQMGIGIWIMPSLLSGNNGQFPCLSIYNAVWSVVYDDGH